jgi:hypothetical protein
MPSDIRSKTKPPGVTDPARATPAFFVGASFSDSSPDADPDARLYDRAPHPVQIAGSVCVLHLPDADSVRRGGASECRVRWLS